MSSSPSALHRGTAMDPRIKARRIEVRRGAGRRRLQRLVDLGLVLSVALCFGAALRSPLLDVDEIQVAGAQRTPVAAVREHLGIAAGDPLMDVDLGAAGAGVAALPWVDEVRLERGLDGTVSVSLTERTPVAIVGPPGAQLLVDGDGRVLAPAADVASGDGPLVRVAGVRAGLEPGDRLQARHLDALAAARLVASTAPGAVLQIEATDDDLVATLAVGGTARLGDAGQLEAKVRSLVTVLEQVDLTCLAVLDVRVPGSPVLTRDEPCS